MTDHSIVQPSGPKNYIYRNNTLRTSVVTYSFLIFTILSTAAITTLGYMFFLFQNTLASPTDEYKQAFNSFATDLRNINLGILMTYFICGIIFLFWMYRANNNMHSLNTDKKFKFTPIKSIASFFIPILCLIWPEEALEEIWKASQKSSHTKRNNIILTWFIIFLVYNAVWYSLHHGNKIVNVRAALAIEIIMNCLGIISALMIIKIAREINRNQNSLHHL